MAARGLDLVVEVAHLAQRHSRIDDFPGECERAFAQFAFLDQRVDGSPFVRQLGAEGVARHVSFEGLLDPDQARQALGSAGAGNDAELDLRLAELRGRYGDPVVAGLGQFEAAAERRAVDRRNHRLGASLDRGLNVVERGPLGRLAEFGNVGAGNKSAAVADQHDGLHRGVGRCLRDAGTEAVADVGGKRVDRRRVDREHGDVAFAGEIGHGIDGGHFARSLCFPPVLYISSHN